MAMATDRNGNDLTRSGPKDGWAYSPIELEAIAHIPIELDDLITNRVRRHQWFEHIEDKDTAELIAKATLAEVLDNEPEAQVTANEGDVEC